MRFFTVGMFLFALLPARLIAEGGCPTGQVPYTASAPEGSASSIASCGPIPSNVSSPVWANRWGAAADDGAGTFGMSANEKSKKKAEKAAIAKCKERGGQACAVYMTYTNQCLAMAASSDNSNTARAPDEKLAQQNSVANCQKRSYGKACQVYYSACSLPVRIR